MDVINNPGGMFVSPADRLQQRNLCERGYAPDVGVEFVPTISNESYQPQHPYDLAHLDSDAVVEEDTGVVYYEGHPCALLTDEEVKLYHRLGHVSRIIQNRHSLAS